MCLCVCERESTTVVANTMFGFDRLCSTVLAFVVPYCVPIVIV